MVSLDPSLVVVALRPQLDRHLPRVLWIQAHDGAAGPAVVWRARLVGKGRVLDTHALVEHGGAGYHLGEGVCVWVGCVYTSGRGLDLFVWEV